MTIEEQLTTRLKDAMRDKRQNELDVLRMVKTRATLAKTVPGFSGPTDDAFWLEVIGGYVKNLKKSLAEYEAAGPQGESQAVALRWEIAYLEPFLPQALGADELRSLVRQVIAETGAAGPKMVGKVIGAVLKQRKDGVDVELLKRLAAEELG